MYVEKAEESKMDEMQLKEWTGTGFALKNGYVVTNYHVIENAKSINIQGVNGDFAQQYDATIVATDKYNDLALLQITLLKDLALFRIVLKRQYLRLGKIFLYWGIL